MVTINISLPDCLQDWIQEQVKVGNFSSSSDYVIDLILQDSIAHEQQIVQQVVITDGIKNGINQSNNIIVSPKNSSWDAFFNSTSAFDDDFLNDREF